MNLEEIKARLSEGYSTGYVGGECDQAEEDVRVLLDEVERLRNTLTFPVPPPYNSLGEIPGNVLASLLAEHTQIIKDIILEKWEEAKNEA